MFKQDWNSHRHLLPPTEQTFLHVLEEDTECQIWNFIFIKFQKNVI